MKALFRKIKDDRGAVVVEASISLPIFIFTIFIILSIINIAYAQTKIGVALSSAAKEISQYSYLYYAMGLDGGEEWLMGKTDNVDAMYENIDLLIGNAGGAVDNIGKGDINGATAAIENGSATAAELEQNFQDALGDPAGFVVGLFAGELIKGINSGKSLLASVVGRGFMKKNLTDVSDGDPNAFLRSMHVVGGMNGLYFDGSTWLESNAAENSVSPTVSLKVTYQIQVVRLLNQDIKLTFSQSATGYVWGRGGDSSIGDG
jgi:hypothetical protein